MESQAVMIPQVNPGASYAAHKGEIDAAVARVLSSGWYLNGEEVRQFEAEFGAWLMGAQVVGVGNGTDALELALRALGIGAGDEVVTSAMTASATVCAIASTGALPVLVDIDAGGLLDLSRLEAAIGARTRAVVPVHLYGFPVDLAALASMTAPRQIRLVEDCAQAHGARFKGQRVGTFGDVAAFSFYPTKNLAALGDGGAVASSDADLTARVRRLAQYGWARRYVSDEVGMNTRLGELQAAVLRVKLRALEQDNARRRSIAARYDRGLSGVVVTPPVLADREPVYHLYVIRHPERDRLRADLERRGIQTGIHYPVPIHLQPAYRELGDPGAFPQAERLANEAISLPLFPEMSDADVQVVIDAVIACA